MNETTPHPLALTQGLTGIARERRRELRNLSRKLQAAEMKVQQLRHDLDRHFYIWHDDGSTITELSLAAGVSRASVYKAIERFKAELKATR